MSYTIIGANKKRGRKEIKNTKSSFFLAQLHNHRPSNSDIIRQDARSRRSARQRDVHDASEVRGQRASGGGVEGGESGAAGCARVREAAELRARSRVARDLDIRASREARYSRSGAGHSECRERREDEVRASGTRRNKGGGEGEDGFGAEGGVERGRRDGEAGGGADEGLVAGLDGEDGGGGAEDGAVGDQRRRAQVGRHPDALEHRRRRHHPRRVREPEVVRARLHRLDPGLRDRALEKPDVRFLAAPDALEVGELCCAQAERGELVVGKLREALLVEGRFEPL